MRPYQLIDKIQISWKLRGQTFLYKSASTFRCGAVKNQLPRRYTPKSRHALMRSPAISPALTLTTLNRVSLSPWVDSVQPWMCTLGSGSAPATLGTSWYVLVTYTFEGGPRPVSWRSEPPPRMGENDLGEVGGVLMLLEVEVEVEPLVVPGAPMWRSDGNEASESFSCV